MKKLFVSLLILFGLAIPSFAGMNYFGYMAFDQRTGTTKIYTAAQEEAGYMIFDSRTSRTKIYLDPTKIGGGTGGGTWGSITGTLSNQTDLNSALSGKVNSNARLTDIARITFAKGYTLYYDGSNLVGLAPLGTNAFGIYMSGTIPVWKWVTANKPICSDANGIPAVCAGTEGVWAASSHTHTRTSTIAKTITNPATADDYVFFKAPAAMTLTHIYALYSGRTSVTFNIQECDAAAANCANVMNSDCISGTTGTDCTINDTAIASGGWLMLQTVSVSGSVTYWTFEIVYTTVE